MQFSIVLFFLFMRVYSPFFASFLTGFERILAVLFGSFQSSIKCQITKHSKMFHVKHLFCLFGFYLNRKFYICTFVYSNDRICKYLIDIYGFYFVFLYICFCCFIENEFDYTLKVVGSIRIVDFVVCGCYLGVT